MGICFSSYSHANFSRYNLTLKLKNVAEEKQKVVDEQKFYFYEIAEGGIEVKSDKFVDGFTLSELNYVFSNLVLPSHQYVLKSDNDEYLGYIQNNGEIEKIVLPSTGGSLTYNDVIVYAIPDYATVLYSTGGRLIINEAKEDREANKALYGNIVKVYDGMLSSNAWAHPYIDDVANVSKIKRAEFGSVTTPITLETAFKGLNQVTLIDLTNLNTTLCTNFKETFANCSELITMDISKVIVTQNTTILGGMFNGASKYVINSDLLHWDTSNVLQFGSAFSNIGNTTFTPKLDTSNGEIFNSMFGYNPRLITLDLSTFDTSSAQELNYMFTRCDNLTTIYAKPTFVQPAGVQGTNMFTYDTKLVGGQGTVWDSAEVGLTRAYIDELPDQPGYFTDKDAATYKTTLFADGTFIINESSHDRTANIAVHGNVIREYDPLDTNHNYVFTTPTQVPWGEVINEIKHISIGSQIQPTSTAYWFNNTTQCQDVNFNNLDTSKVTDMSYMLSGCGASTIDVTSFNTSRVTDMSGMFASCKATSLDCSSFDTRNVTDMDYMFENCMQLINVDVSSFNTSNVTLMEAMFKNCGNLQQIDMANWDTSSVTTMKDMFAYDGILHNPMLANFDTSNVTDMRGMFDGVGAVTGGNKTLDVRHFDTSKVTDMTNMFRGCGFTRIWVDGFDTSNVTNMSSMFSGCPLVAELDLSTFDTSKVTNMNNMFQSCGNLVTIKVSDFDTSVVTSSNNMFFQCNSIRGGAGTTYSAVNIDKTYARNDEPPASPGYFTGKLATVLFTDGTLIINEDIDNRETDVTAHGAVVKTYGPHTSNDPYVFASDGSQLWANERASITSVKFGGNIKPVSTAYWFMGCGNVTSIDTANLNTSDVTDMSSMFENCINLTTLDVSSFSTSKVTSMASMFSYCENLATIDVSNFDTSQVVSMDSMFRNCSSVTALDVSGFNTSNVTTFFHMFNRCNSITSINVSSFDTSKATMIAYMFANMTGLTSLNLSNFNTANVTNFNGVFSGCSGITSLNISSFNTSEGTTMNSTFYGMASITALDVSSFNTSKVTNMTSMFRECTRLVTIYASDDFVVTQVTRSGTMFSNCVSIRGGMGTTYNASYIQKEGAKVDGGTANPGYFTQKP